MFLRGLMAALLSVGISTAHVVDQLFAELESDEAGWRLEILFDAGISLPEMRNDPFSPAPLRDWLAELDEAAHGRLRTEAERYVQEWVILLVNGEAIEWKARFPDWETTPPDFPKLLNGGAYFRLVIAQPWPEGGGTLACTPAEGDHPSLAIQVTETSFLMVRPGKEVVLAERQGSAKEDSGAPPGKRSNQQWFVAGAILLVITGALMAWRFRSRPRTST